MVHRHESQMAMFRRFMRDLSLVFGDWPHASGFGAEETNGRP